MRLFSMLDDSLTAFLQQGVAINIGTRNARLEPSACYVGAALVDDDRKHLTVFVPTVGADRVLADLQANGQAAIVFARPEDDRACQVKGTFVSVRPATAAEAPIVDEQYSGFLRQLEIIGMPGESSRSWTVWPALAIRLRVTAVFDQTPGPKAGAAIV